MTTIPKPLLALRVEPEILARFDAIIAARPADMRPSRSTVYRAALVRGLEALEHEYARPAAATAKPAATRPAATKTRRRRS